LLAAKHPEVLFAVGTLTEGAGIIWHSQSTLTLAKKSKKSPRMTDGTLFFDFVLRGLQVSILVMALE
jgi:hypothetical protein